MFSSKEERSKIVTNWLMEEIVMINQLIKKYDEVRKVPTGQCDDYITGWLLDCAYFKDNCRLIAVPLSK